jgi:hypothetical protein
MTARPTHPLLDASGESAGVRWALTETRAPVVHLSPGRANLLGAAARSGRRLVLASDELSGLTPALAQVWRSAGGHWLVRDTHGGMRDGFTGRALTKIADLWRTDAFDFADVAPAHLLVRPADALLLNVTIAVQHPARAETLLGGAVEVAASLAAEEQPLSFGPYEPAGTRWDRSALTRWFAERMPERVVQVAASPDATSLTWVTRTRQGLEEVTEATVHAGSLAAVPQARERAAAALTRLAETAMPQVGIVTARAGNADLLVPPFLQPAPLPVTVLLGPPLLRGLGVDPAALAERLSGRLVGRPKLPCVLVDLPPGLDEAWEAFRILDESTGAIDALTRAAPTAPLAPPAAPRQDGA